MLRRANWVRFVNLPPRGVRPSPADLREAAVLVSKLDGGAAAPNQMGSLSVARLYRCFFENNPMHSSCQLFSSLLTNLLTKIGPLVI